MTTAQGVKHAIKQARQALKAEAYADALAAYAEAAAAFEALPEPLSELEGLYLEWAHAYFKGGQPGDALTTISLYLQRLTVFSPELQERVQYLLAQSHFAYARALQTAEPEKARQHFHKALGYHGLSEFQRAEAFYYQGVVLLHLKALKEATASFDSALQAFMALQEHFWAGMTRLKLGMVALIQGQVEPAKTQAEHVIAFLQDKPMGTGEQALSKTAHELMYELCRYQRDDVGASYWQAKLAES